MIRELGEQERGPDDDGGAHAHFSQARGHLEANVAAAHDHGAFDLPGLLLYFFEVRKGAEGQDTGEADAFDLRHLG